MSRPVLAATLALLAAGPAAACPNILIGDSLAVGMAPYARAAGWQVVARTGVGLAWLRAQRPRCAGRLVLVLGTNDLAGVRATGADAYVRGLAAALAGWRAREATWATPGCFRAHPTLEAASIALDRRVAALPAVSRGREARCRFPSSDGIHTTPAVYRAWWENLSRGGAPPSS